MFLGPICVSFSSKPCFPGLLSQIGTFCAFSNSSLGRFIVATRKQEAQVKCHSLGPCNTHDCSEVGTVCVCQVFVFMVKGVGWDRSSSEWREVVIVPPGCEL